MAASSRSAKSTSGRRAKNPAAARSRGAVDDGVDLGSDKLYFKIGEVAEIVGVEPYVLRYWEGEFSAVRPQKSRTQQRVYRRRDVVTLLRIKHLLYEKKFTIAGARAELKEPVKRDEGGAPVELAKPSPAFAARASLQRVSTLLDEVRAFVNAGDGDDPAQRRAADPAAFVSRRGGARALVEHE